MGRITQRYDIEKDFGEIFIIKLIFKNVSENDNLELHVYKNNDIIKKIKPELIMDNEVYFRISNEFESGCYDFSIYFNNSECLSNRRLIVNVT